MTAKYKLSSIEAILEDSEDEQRGALMGKDEDTPSEAARRQSRSWFDRNMTPNAANTGKERRKHKSSISGSKHQSKSKSKTSNSRKLKDLARDADVPPPRHRRTVSNQSASDSSSSEDEEIVEDHRLVLANARGRLTSPSMVSTFTSLTNRTNKSSGSSGSNSTVTQASVTKRSNLGKQPEIEEALLSPAVPDAPDVFAFLETDSILEKDDDKHHDSESESSSEDEVDAQWPRQNGYVQSSPPPHISKDPSSSSSSASSSFHGEDGFSLRAADNDTDRSTSPERSVKDHDSEPETSPPTDPVSVKIASQMAAAQERQSMYESLHPNLQRVNTSIPHSPSSAMTPRYQPPPNPQARPQGDRFSVTGYELLAYKLSSQNPDMDDGKPIKPMYRKFGALNHRVLLYLQDEISELEEQLHRLDQVESQTRRTERQIIPASRRAAAQAGGELQYHKADVLNKIGYKLAQYNQALSSFNTTQSLNPPDPDDISAYRTYLQTEHPIAEEETHFLDPTDDLVSVYSDNLRPPPPRSYAASTYSNDSPSNVHSRPSTFPPSPVPYDISSTEQSALPGLATAIAVSVLVPILTFNVIPNYIGRLTVTLLVAIGVVGALLQSRILSQGALLGKESITCAGIYGGVMIIMAGIV